MSLNIKICLIAVAFLLYLDFIIVCWLFIRRLERDKGKIKSLKERSSFLHAMFGRLEGHKQKLKTSSYFTMKQSIRLDRKYREGIKKYLDIKKMEKKYVRNLTSTFVLRRTEAAVYLGLLGTKESRIALEKSILKEKSYSVKLYLANALADIGKTESIPVLVSSLIHSHRWYRDKVNMLISDFGEGFHSYLPHIIQSNKLELIELIVDFSSVYYTESLKGYLVDLLDKKQVEVNRLRDFYGSPDIKCCANCTNCIASNNVDNRICRFKGKVSADFRCRKYKVLPVSMYAESNYITLVHKAATILSKVYPNVLDDIKYLNSEDHEIRNTAVKALSAYNTKENIDRLFAYIEDDVTARSAVNSISLILEEKPEYIIHVVARFEQEKNINIKDKLAEILSARIEYFIMKLTTTNTKSVAELIKQILLLGKSSQVVDFLNKNQDIDLENELISILKEVIPSSTQLQKEFSIYLNGRLSKKCGLIHQEEIPAKREEKRDKKLIVTLYVLLFAMLMIFPVIYIIRRWDIVFEVAPLEQVKIFIVDFNYYLVYYSLAVNLIYLLLLILSFFHVKQQSKRWNIKKISLLFKKRILPSISIIAPAYNEKKTIIESTNSLLNLQYPDYELIIVNDGSKDSTLETLIKYYDLTRVDYVFDYRLKTKSVRGIYMNSSMPKLIVVDKENGGKADSLNTGINISTKEYYCGIDADSLLESDALLKLASLTLDHGIETPALGGNIFPINGCVIERGHIKDIHIPKDSLARFQNIEYIRVFMAGRLGWASVNSLLIISGAFGLFRKERVISVGGYLTSSGKYAKDTVGEDMELVVRISRLMRELGKRYKICYAYNANCWTEVPEDLKSLKNQRYRWHRGLIDILTFHKKMLFNPRYGRTGIIAMPYFFIFEMIGPILEIQGYIMVVAAFILGLLNAQIALLLFISTILMGVLISVASLLIAEKDTKYFKTKDMIILIVYAIIENFGPRQLIGLWRVGGYLKMFGKQGGWNKPKRKGFTASNPSVNEVR